MKFSFQILPRLWHMQVEVLLICSFISHTIPQDSSADHVNCVCGEEAHCHSRFFNCILVLIHGEYIQSKFVTQKIQEVS